MELKNKVALITGGASGHGRDYSIELFKQGCKVIAIIFKYNHKNF